jgi:S-DNA-T family DNA segregation ATPase FtsK/SpoIIIE
VEAAIIRQEVDRGGEVWFCDLKAGMEAENYRQVLTRKAYDLDEAEVLLSDLNDEIERRARLYRGKTRLIDDTQEKHILAVFDEVGDLVRTGVEKKQSDHCVSLMRSVLSRGRAENITVLIATQNPRMDALPFRNLLLVSLAMRLGSEAEARMVYGSDEPIRQGARPWLIPINRPGDAYLWDAETCSVVYLHVPYTTDDEIRGLACPSDGGVGGRAEAARKWKWRLSITATSEQRRRGD